MSVKVKNKVAVSALPAKPVVAVLFIAALSAYLSYYLWGANLGAQWSLVDDHEIFRLLGSDQKVTFSEIPRLWLSTEVSSFGHFVRFRPSYYFLRIFECYLWGPSPYLWYLARLVMFAMSFGIFLWLVSRAAGLFLGAAFALFAATARYWPAIWASLGPAETYACFGTALFGLGLYNIWAASAKTDADSSISGPMDTINWVLVAVGALMAIGSKENFVLMAVPTAWLAVAVWRRRALTFAGVVATAVVIISAATVSLAVGLALASSGKDIYMNSVKPGDRLTILWSACRSAVVIWMLAAACAIWRALSAFRRRGSKRVELWLQCLKRICLWEVALALVYVSQIYFYNSVWAPESRYAFPGDLAVAFAAIVPVICVVRNPDLLPSPGERNVARIRITVALLLLTVTWFRGYEPSIQRTQQNAILTRSVTNCINRVTEAARYHPEAPIALSTDSLGDYESYYSVRTFLRARGVENPLVIDKSPIGYSVAGFPPALGNELLKNVDALQSGAYGFAPHSILDSASTCLEIGFMHNPASGRCINLGRLAP